MSLKSVRQSLLTSLTDAKITTYYGWGQFNAPCARIFPGDPWVGLSGMAGGRRAQSWEIWAVAGKVDSAATFDDLEALVMAVNAALENMPKFSQLEWRRPTLVDMGGTRYLACRGILQSLAEV